MSQQPRDREYKFPNRQLRYRVNTSQPLQCQTIVIRLFRASIPPRGIDRKDMFLVKERLGLPMQLLASLSQKWKNCCGQAVIDMIP